MIEYTKFGITEDGLALCKEHVDDFRRACTDSANGKRGSQSYTTEEFNQLALHYAWEYYRIEELLFDEAIASQVA